jgi:hypothetical protein
MSLSTIAAGAKLRASFLNAIVNAFNALSVIFDQKESVQQTGSTSSSSAAGASATSLLSISNPVFKAGRAYSVENIGGALGSTTLEADFSLWKNGTAGTQIGAFYRTPCVAGGAVRNCYGKIYVINTSGSDVTYTTINLAVAASTGTVTHEAASNRPRQFIIRDVGLASAYANAFVLT